MTACLRIAIADDEPDMREYLQRVLPRLGHEVVAIASNGEDLVDVVRKSNPDLVITDLKMPTLDGEAAVRQIRAQVLIPVVFLSAYDRPAGWGLDPDCAYVNKPFKWTDLDAAIRSVVERRTPDPNREAT